MGGMSVGEGLWAIGQGLRQLDDDLRERARRKIDIVLSQSGNDWTQAAQVIQTDPNLQKAFRKAYGVEFDASKIQKSIEQRLNELKLEEGYDTLDAKRKARSYTEERTNPQLAFGMTQPESAAAYSPYASMNYLTPEEQRQVAMQKTNIALDPNEAMRAVNSAINYYGNIQMLNPDVLKAAGWNINQLQNQNQYPFAQGITPMSSSILNGVMNMFGGGGQQPALPAMAPGSTAAKNVNAAALGQGNLAARERGNDIRQQEVDQNAPLVKARTGLAEAQTGLTIATIKKVQEQTTNLEKLRNQVNGTYNKLDPRDKAAFEAAISADDAELRAALRDRTEAYKNGDDALVQSFTTQIDAIKNRIAQKSAQFKNSGGGGGKSGASNDFNFSQYDKK